VAVNSIGNEESKAASQTATKLSEKRKVTKEFSISASAFPTPPMPRPNEMMPQTPFLHDHV
jgi:hypothetical protein